MRRFDRLQHDELEVGPLSRAKRVLLEDQLAFLRMKKPSTSALALRHRLAPPCLAKKVAIRSPASRRPRAPEDRQWRARQCARNSARSRAARTSQSGIRSRASLAVKT